MPMKHTYKKSKNVTSHAARRGKQRIGAGKNQTKILANRAYHNGIDFGWTHGALRDFMSPYVGIKRLYANAVYIFRKNETLVTILNIDPSYEKNLLEYVDYPTYVWYITNRYKYKSDITTPGVLIFDAKRKTSKEIRKFLGNKGTLVDVILNGRSGTVLVSTNKKDAITSEDIKAFKDKFGMTLRVKCTEVELSKLTKYNVSKMDLNDLDAKIKQWFEENAKITVKTNYISTKATILRVTSKHKKEDVSTNIKKRFEYQFGLRLFIRDKFDGISGANLNPTKFKDMRRMKNWLIKNYPELPLAYVIDRTTKKVVIKLCDETTVPNYINEAFIAKFKVPLEVQQDGTAN